MLCAGFLLVAASGATLQLRCVGFPLLHSLSRCGAWDSGHKTLGHGTLEHGTLEHGRFLGHGTLEHHGTLSTGSAIVAHGLSCPKTGGIFLDHGLELVFTVLQGGFLITGLPGKPEIQRFTCKVEHPNTFTSAIYDSYKCPFIERLSYSVFLVTVYSC